MTESVKLRAWMRMMDMPKVTVVAQPGVAYLGKNTRRVNTRAIREPLKTNSENVSMRKRKKIVSAYTEIPLSP